MENFDSNKQNMREGLTIPLSCRERPILGGYGLNYYSVYENYERESILDIRCYRSSPSVPVAVLEIQNQKQKNLRGETYAPRLVILRGA